MLKEFIYLIETELSKEVMLGRKLRDYVLRELEKYPVEIVGSDFNNSLDPTAEVTYVLYLDMPLIKRETLNYVFGQMKSKNINRINFLNGYAVGVGEAEKNYFLTSEEFLRPDNAKNKAAIYDAMRKRIIDRNLLKGVYIDSPNAVIDDVAIIKKDAVISGNAVIKGSCYIGKSKIYSSTVINSVIGDECKIKNAYIKNTNVADKIVVEPFAAIESSMITENVAFGRIISRQV